MASASTPITSHSLPTLIAAAHTAHAIAYETAKAGTHTLDAYAAQDRRAAAWRAVADALAAMGRPCSDVVVTALVVAYAQKMRGDIAGAGERFAGMVAGEEDDTERRVAA